MARGPIPQNFQMKNNSNIPENSTILQRSS
jgi:hypothetical protein